MLKIKTYLDKSSINGIGIFATEDIPNGKIIWEFNPLIDLAFSAEKWEELKRDISSESFEQIQRYSYKTNDIYYLCVDNAQFMNHSKDAYNISNNSDNDTMYANREIRAGEELLCNYYEYSDEDDDNLILIKQLGV